VGIYVDNSNNVDIERDFVTMKAGMTSRAPRAADNADARGVRAVILAGGGAERRE
jgi:hypothetical protein